MGQKELEGFKKIAEQVHLARQDHFPEVCLPTEAVWNLLKLAVNQPEEVLWNTQSTSS